MTAESATMTVRLPSEVKERLDRLAKTTQRSRSWLAASAITEFVKTQEWQLTEIQRGIREADKGEFATSDEVTTLFAKWSDAP